MPITPKDIEDFITGKTGTYSNRTHKERFELLMARLTDQFNYMPEIKEEAEIFSDFYYDVILKMEKS